MKKLMVLAIVLFAAIAASASTVQIQFGGFHPQGTQDWELGYPYYASVNGGSTINVMCDDWEHGGLKGDSWTANVTNLGTGDLTNLRFNQLPDALTLYDEAGWLILQTRVSPSTDWTDINFAVWRIFDPNAPLPGHAQSWYDQARTEAHDGFPGVNFHDVLIYTPLNQYGLDPNGKLDQNAPQELLTIVPEPTTLALLAGGLLGAWGRKQLG